MLMLHCCKDDCFEPLAQLVVHTPGEMYNAITHIPSHKANKTLVSTLNATATATDKKMSTTQLQHYIPFTLDNAV